MTYTDALKTLGNRDAKTIKNNTILKRNGDGTIGLCLHGHEIITFYPNGDTRLNSCGWRTVTTKQRLNQYGPVTVYQKDYTWYIGGFGDTEFRDKMVIDSEGSIIA